MATTSRHPSRNKTPKQHFKVCFCFRRMFRLKVADEIDILFKEYSQHIIMSMDDLCDFLVQFQGEEEGVAIKKHAQTIFDSLRHLNIFHRRGLHVEAFFRYLLSDLNVPLAEVIIIFGSLLKSLKTFLTSVLWLRN